MFKKTVVVLAALAFMSASADAAGVNGATVSKDKLTTMARPGSSHYVPAPPPDRTDTIFSNIGRHYPLGLYFCCFGNTISGPNSPIGQTIWNAVEFTPAGDATIKEIDVSVGLAAGSNHIVVNIAEDNGGVPGTVLGSFPVSGAMGVFGDCCNLVTAASHIRVTGGTPYWLFLSTDGQSDDTWAAWPYNATDQVNTLNTAGYDGSTWTAFGPGRPAVSFALLGKNH